MIQNRYQTPGRGLLKENNRDNNLGNKMLLSKNNNESSDFTAGPHPPPPITIASHFGGLVNEIQSNESITKNMSGKYGASGSSHQSSKNSNK